jgi:NDP-sugar pyrophosphorylase family protein/ubiquinone/menaquinone biosynthesis C-methylase UbiE
MSELVGLIPAAGKGVRAYPYTATIPKSMLEVDGVPVLQRNIELMRDQLGIDEITIVVGYQGDVIRRRFADGAALGVRLTYVANPRVDLELPYSVYLAAPHITRPCCMILADECYVGSNHRALLEQWDADAPVTCALIASEYAKQIRKNYVVTLRDGLIVDLIEKPAAVSGPQMGTGTYLLRPELFRLLVDAYRGGPDAGPRDWTGWLATLARSGVRIAPAHLTGKYVNINSRDDLNSANYLVRALRFDEKQTSLIYVIDGEEEAAAGPVSRFAEVSDIDEVVAVARRMTVQLAALAARPKVRVVVSPTPAMPLGDLVKLGLESASGSILLMSYSDDTFSPHDVGKLLVYLRDADMVVGTRTTRQMIEQGANMRGIVRAAHVVLAKMLQLLWLRFECRFTDICCVYRGLWRSTYVTIRDNLSASGVEIFPEMVIEVLRARRRIIEIPVNYYNRDLEYAYVRGKYQSVATFARVIALLVRKRWQDSLLGRWFGADTPRAGAVAAGRPAAAADGSANGDGAPGAPGADTGTRDEAARYRALERAWQDDVGFQLLDKPYESPGSAAVFDWQLDRLIALIDGRYAGVVVEIGCGRGHLLSRVRAVRGATPRTLVGMDLSKAVFNLPARGLDGVQGDGEFLPFRDASADCVIFDGSLHHCIDYASALREATRVLTPGGSLIIFEPVVSRFSQLVHRLLDPIIFRSCSVYESPIDIRYKSAFRQEVVARVLRQQGMQVRDSRSDFLAYPFTGCYAGSLFGRSERFMRFLIALEAALATIPVLGRVARSFAWRFTIVATRPETARPSAA